MFSDTILCRDFNTEVRLTDSHGKARKLWQENALGRKLRRAGREVRIPFLTGNYEDVLRNKNLITNVGHAAANARMSGQGSYSTLSLIHI